MPRSYAASDLAHRLPFALTSYPFESADLRRRLYDEGPLVEDPGWSEVWVEPLGAWIAAFEGP